MNSNLPESDRTFSYYLPHKELLPYIAYYSVQHTFFPVIAPLFIPDLGGCIIVNCYQNDLDMTVWGPFNQLTAVENSPFKVLARYFIEFQPGGLSRFVYQNSLELLNQKSSLDQINTGIDCSLRPLFEKHFDTEEDLIFSLNQYFLGLLEKSTDVFASGRPLLYLLQEFSPHKTVDSLSKDAHYSSRHINRYLNALTGVSAKGYFRIKRFNQAVQMLKKQDSSIEQIAFALGFYDAAHFVHEFTELCGLSPTLYRKNRSGFYNEVLKRF